MIDIVAAMNDPGLFQPWFHGESWDGWRAILRGAFALPMTEAERDFFRSVADRDPPARPVKELWVVAGRRSGKDSIASLIAAYSAALFNDQDRLRRGERAVIACFGCDRDQSRIVLNYARSYFEDIPMLKALVTRETQYGFELNNSVDVVVATNNFKSARGRPFKIAILDEVSFYSQENSASPDEELFRAIKPSFATLPNSMLIGISSPYRRSGLLYAKFRDHYGKDGDILVVRAATTVLNPTIDQSIIDEALEADPAAARAEWLAEFRTDIEQFVSREVVDSCVAPGRRELPRVSGVRYAAFVDPSGGSADSMTLAVAHAEKGGRVIVDAVREQRPPFSPDAVVAEFSSLLKSYGVAEVAGDHYGGLWPKERFQVAGIKYVPAEKPKSDLYRDALPLLNSGRVELLDHPRLIAQLCGLERRTARSGKDSIDHAPGAHDDIANAVAGAICRVGAAKRPVVFTSEMLAGLRAAGPALARGHYVPQTRFPNFAPQADDTRPPRSWNPISPERLAQGYKREW
jgi:hypothetical protein